MDQEQTPIGYDQFMPHPFQERLRIFNEVSAENRALLFKAHIERWLAANRPRLTPEQMAVLEEITTCITPELYQAERDMEEVERKAAAMRKKAEAVFSREDVRQIASDRADYVPPVEGKKG